MGAGTSRRRLSLYRRLSHKVIRTYFRPPAMPEIRKRKEQHDFIRCPGDKWDAVECSFVQWTRTHNLLPALYSPSSTGTSRHRLALATERCLVSCGALSILLSCMLALSYQLSDP